MSAPQIVREIGEHWQIVGVAAPMSMWEGREDGPVKDIRAALVQNKESEKIYNDDRPGTLRMKCAGGSFLRAGATLSYLTPARQAIQAVKLVPDFISTRRDKKLHGTQRGERWAELRHKRWTNITRSMRELPRDIGYQLRLTGKTAKGVIAGREKLYDVREGVAELEWKHTRGKKHACLMPCFQPLNYAIAKRSATNALTEDGCKAMLAAERDLLMRAGRDPASRQLLLMNWMQEKDKSYDDSVLKQGVPSLAAWRSPEYREAREELLRRTPFAFGADERPTILEQNLSRENLTLRFEGTSFRALGPIVPDSRHFCFASCLFFARDFLNSSFDTDAALIQQAKGLSEQYCGSSSDEVLFEQAVYRAILGRRVCPKVLARYKKVCRGEEIKPKKVPLAPLVREYMEKGIYKEKDLRSHVFDSTDTSIDEATYALLVELDLAFWRYFGGILDPVFEHRLQAKNALGEKYGVAFKQVEGFSPNRLYLISQSNNTQLTAQLADGRWLCFDPALGSTVLDECPIKDTDKLLEISLGGEP